MQSGTALATTLSHLIVEECYMVHLVISLTDKFSLNRVRILTFSTSHNCLTGMIEKVEKK